MRNFVSPHVHPQSLDSGSTLEDMVDREIELNTGHGIITDHGTLGACLDWYDLCKKKGIKPILGIEAYFRDEECPILDAAGLVRPLINERKQELIKEKSTYEYQKYFHLTMHFLDQAAYLAAVRVLSRAEFNFREKHGSEWKPLFTWADLEELGQYNITIGSSCLVGMVSRHLLANRPDLAEQYYLKLRHTFKPGNFYVEMFPHDCSHNWENAILLTVEGEEKPIRLREDRKVLIDGERLRVKDLLRRKIVPGKLTLDGTFYYSALTEIKKPIISAELKKGFFRNECTDLAPDGDMQLAANRFVLALAEKYGDPVFISDDSHFARPADKLAQDVRLNTDGKDNWKFWGSYHRRSTEEASKYFVEKMQIPLAQIERWVEMSHEWASRFDDFKLDFQPQLPTKFYESEDGLLGHVRKLIAKHGRLDLKNPKMTERLTVELNMLMNNGTINLLPYFLPLEEVVDTYQQNDLLTGPGRGSAAGLLLTYLLGITHVNPLDYNLSLERFITEDRIKAGTLPDIDQDLESREFLIGEDGHSGWLQNRFGADHVVQLSTNTNLRLKSSIKDVHRSRNTLTKDVEALCKRLPTPPQGISDHDFVFGKYDDDGQLSKEIPGILDNPALLEYTETYPDEWKAVQQLLGIVRQKSIHACAFVIGNTPLSDFLPLTLIGGVPVTQYTAKSVERAGGIKIDFLVLNSLHDIGSCLKLIRERHLPSLEPYVSIDGERIPKVRLLPAPESVQGPEPKLLDIWKLPEDQEVFKSLCGGDTETIFQLNTSGATRYLALFNKEGKHLIRSIEDIAAFTSLDRPGPLNYQIGPGHNMLHEFVVRKKGDVDRTSPAFSQKLYDTLPETHGIMVYQEQLMKIVQELGGFNPIEANNFRIYVGKKKLADLMAMRPKFLEGAAPQVGQAEAEKLFDMMVTFGQYGFNKSHAVCYSIIAYACAYLKHHYPLEWWCAVLQNASKTEVYGKFWRYCRELILPPDINKSGTTFQIENDKIRAPIALMDGVGPAIRDELARHAPYHDIRDLLTRVNRRVVNRNVLMKLLISGVMDSLFEDTSFIEERYEQYQQARHEILGEDMVPLPEEYRNLLPLQLYCVRKHIIPTYLLHSPNFIQTFLKFAPGPLLATQYGASLATDCKGIKYLTFRNGKNDYKLVYPEEFERLFNSKNEICNCAIPAYVIEEKRFSYAQGTKEALKLTVDFDGVVVEMVKWPDRKTGRVELSDRHYEFVTLKGSVVLLYLSRWKEDRDFAIDDIKWVCGIPN